MYTKHIWRPLLVGLTGLCCHDGGPGDSGAALRWTQPLSANEAGWQGIPGIVGDIAIGLGGRDAHGFNLRDGELQWRRAVNDERRVLARNVATGGGRVFVADVERVTAIDLATGAEAWRFVPDGEADRCEIAVDDVAVYVGTASHRVYALAVASGQPIWTVDIGPDWEHAGIVTGIVVSGDTAYVAAEQWTSPNGFTRVGLILALDRRDGTEVWRYTGSLAPANTVSAAPRVIGRMLLAPDLLTRSFFALDRWTGEELWRVQNAPGSLGPLRAPIENAGIVYAATQGGVYAVDFETGADRWKREDLVGAKDVAICGRVLMVQNQTIQVLDPATGRSITSFLDANSSDFPTSDIAVSGNRAFVIGNTAAYGIVCDE